MLTMHGAFYLQLRTDGAVHERSVRAARVAGLVFLALFAAAGVWIATGIDGYRITGMPSADSAFAPGLKTVERVQTGWLANYSKYRWTIAAPVAVFGAGLLALAFVRRLPTTALILSCASVAGVVLTAGFALFPFIMPSSSQPASSLTAWDAVSSYRTLQVMFWAVVIFLPIIILYTSWVYRVMRGKITTEHVRENSHSLY